MTILNQNEFEALVATPDKLTVIDFFATWCGPCKMLAPVLEEVSAAYPDVAFGKVDVDEEEELARRYGISVIPTLVAIKNGEVVKKTTGYMDTDALRAWIDGAL